MADTPLESAAFVFARPIRTPEGAWRLVVHDWYVVDSNDYAARTEFAIDLPPAIVNAAIQRAIRTASAMVLVHSHPMFAPVPSDRDRAGESLLVPAIQRRLSAGVPVARLIVAQDSLSATLLPGEHKLDVVEIAAGIRWYSDLRPTPGASRADRPFDPRFDRQVRAFGVAGQERLRVLTVVIVGLGGTGSLCAQQLAHLGVGRLILIDPESIEETNLNRLVGATREDIGRPKVDVAAAMIRRINPDVDVIPLVADIRDGQIARRLLDADVFLGCTDSQGSRAVMSQLSYQYLIPGVDLGVVIHASPDTGVVTHVSGRVQMLAPGLACLLCSAVLDPEQVRRDLLSDEARAQDAYIPGYIEPQPSVISINSATSALAVTMLLSAVTDGGVPVAARHQRLRLETGIVTRVDTAPVPSCPWCSSIGAFARGDSWAMPGRMS